MKYIKLKSLLILPLLAVIVSLSSCRDFLSIEDYSVDMFDYDSIFSNKQHLEEYLWGAAALLPDEANIWGSSSATGSNIFPGVSASDECVNQWNNTTQPGTMFVLGGINADNVANSFGGRTLNVWSNMYKIIRKTNMIIHNIDRTSDLSTIERNNFLGFTYFLRAYAYYHILMNQGPVVIIGDDLLEVNREAEYYNNHRATYDESVEYICEEFERAARLMTSDRVSISQYGRPNKAAAYALIARIRLQHASPMFNGGPTAKRFADWKRSTDNVPYIQQEPDNSRWAVAAWAAKRVMDMNQFELHVVKADTLTTVDGKANPDKTPELHPGLINRADWPNGPGAIDHLKSYANMFNGETLPYQNREIIWGRWSTTVRAYTQHSFSKFHGGWGGMSLPQKVIDNYYMNDGSEYPNKGNMTATKLMSDSTWSGYKIGSNRVSMYYVNREPRFYASVGFQGCYWPMTTNTESGTGEDKRYADYSKNGQDGLSNALPNKTDYSLTGYVIKKFIHPNDAWTGTGNSRMNKPFAIIRYAEILLSYVEALNNIEGSYLVRNSDGKVIESLGEGETGETFTRDIVKMANAYNPIRWRAGLDGLKDSQLNDVDEMFRAIERERMIEFLHEGRRYYDVRRWGVYEQRDRERIEGMDVEADGDSFYNIVSINNSVIRNRITHRRMVFLPLSTAELKKVSNLDQNFDW